MYGSHIKKIPKEILEKEFDEVLEEFVEGKYSKSFPSNLLLKKDERLIFDCPEIQLCEDKIVKSGGDIKKINRLAQQLDKLNSIGGMNSIVPSEGIVFIYKGNTYKLTGAFAPINQITGMIHF